MAWFGLASLAAGFATNTTQLIVARGCQGIGAAIIFPGSLAILSSAFPPERRGVAMGIYGTIGTTFLCAGPVVGGLFTEYLSWRWIFWINPLLAVMINIVVLKKWHTPTSTARLNIDYPGLITMISGLGLLVLVIMQGVQWGWLTPLTLGLIAASLLLLGLFVTIENRRPTPLIEVDLFKNGNFTVYNLLIFTGQYNKVTIIIFGALYLQHILGMSPFIAGLALLAAMFFLHSPLYPSANG